MTTNEFYIEIINFSQKYETRDLETYLSALYVLVLQHKDETVNAEFLLKILAEAFTSEPASFDEKWLKCEAAPHDNGIIRKFTNPEIKEDLDRTFQLATDEFEFTLSVLRFQIAELHKMRGKQLESEYRYFGIKSETGNDWYNFDPHTNLECGVRCGFDNSDDEEEEMLVNWATLGMILEDGRIYE